MVGGSGSTGQHSMRIYCKSVFVAYIFSQDICKQKKGNVSIKCVFEYMQMRRLGLSWARETTHKDICPPLINLVIYNNSVYRRRRHWSVHSHYINKYL